MVCLLADVSVGMSLMLIKCIQTASPEMSIGGLYDSKRQMKQNNVAYRERFYRPVFHSQPKIFF